MSHETRTQLTLDRLRASAEPNPDAPGMTSLDHHPASTPRRTIRRALADRAWSRAGAVAAVLSTDRPRRVVSMSGRIALLVLGSWLIGVSVAFMLWNNVGPGPLDVFIGGIRNHTGLPLTFAVWITIAVILVAATLLGRRPGIGSIIGPFMVGPILQIAFGHLSSYGPPESFPLQVGIHLLAIMGVGIGAGCKIVSGLGAGAGELLTAGAADRSGRKEPPLRLAFEVTWLSVGFLLGGPIGWGTMVVAAAIGPAVARGTQIVERAVNALNGSWQHVATLAPSTDW